MAINVRSTSTLGFGADRTASTVPAPAGVAPGDVLIAFLAVSTAGPEPSIPVTPPAGWTEFGSSPITVSKADPYTRALRAYRKVAGSEPASWDWTHAAATTEAMVMALTGVDTTTPVTNVTVNEYAPFNGQTTTALGFTTTYDGALVILAEVVWNDATAVLPPGGTTPSFGTRYAGGTLYVCDGILTSAGPTGDKSHANGNTSGSNPWGAYLIGVQPSSVDTRSAAGSASASATATAVGQVLGAAAAATGSGGNSALVSGAALTVAAGAGAASASASAVATAASVTFPAGAGSADGLATADGVGLGVTTTGAVGQADGSATVTGAGTSLGTGEAVGSSDGSASVTGTGEAIPPGSTPAVGLADGVALAEAVGAATAAAAGLASGSAFVASSTPGLALSGGGGGGAASDATYRARKEYERKRRLRDQGDYVEETTDRPRRKKRPPQAAPEVIDPITSDDGPSELLALIAEINRLMAVRPLPRAPVPARIFDPEDDAETLALLD